jgi:DNA-binding XRE family transcriptional regulator
MKKILAKNKIVQSKSLKIYSFDEVFKEDMKSPSFVAAYHEEINRLTLASQIKKFRTLKKMTQEAFAKKANMPQSVIARAESGKHTISLVTLSKIAGALGKKIELV